MRMTQSPHALRSSSSFPRRVRRGGIAVPLAIVLVAGAAIGGTAFLLTRGNDTSAASSAELFQASITSFEITVNASGELEAARQTEVRSQLEKPSDIVFIVPEGTRVSKGDLLVELASEVFVSEIEEETLRVEQARNDLIAAENTLEIQKNSNESAMRDATLKLELAEIEWEKWIKGDDKKRREELALNIETSKKDDERAREKYMRSQELFSNDFLSRDELQKDEIEALRAKASVTKADLELEVYEEYERPKQIKTLQSNITQARAELERTERANASNLASRQADVVNRTRSLSIREDRLASDEEQLRNTKIFAPQDGLVVYATSLGERRGMMMMGGSGPLQVGYTVRPNEALIVLPDTSGMVASVRVHESLAGRIRPGQSADIKIDAAQGRVFEGTVSSIGILAESGGWRDPNLREYTVKIAMNTTPEEAKMLKPAMRAEADIILGSVDNTLAIPIQAVFNEGATRYVYVPSGGQFKKAPVLIGQRSNTFAQVLVGLEEGQSVLLREPTAGEITSTDISEEAMAALTEKAKALGVPMRTGMPPQAIRGARGAQPTSKSNEADAPATARRPEGGEQSKTEGAAEKSGKPADAQAAVPVKD
jgi:HlyD family secretion protein